MEYSFSNPKPKKNRIDRFFGFLYGLKPSDSFILKLALIATIIFGMLALIYTSIGMGITVPTSGGKISEGIVGTPRFINPVLAVTRADKDLSALIYDGLMQLGADGVLHPNVAESVTISEDGLTYNVLIKQNVQFSDGHTLTANDVLFTISRIQDPSLGSPLRANFEGVTAEKIGDYELNLILPEAYAPFIENLTFGILPEHIWKDAHIDEFPFSQHNSEPIGSGPYHVQEIVRNPSGIPEKYVLTRTLAYHLPLAKIEEIELYFFPTEEKLIEAFNKGIVTSVVGVDPKELSKYEVSEKMQLMRIPLPRTFAVFFNQNKSAALRDPAVREALDVALDRKALVETLLNGYGSVLTSPIPPGFGIETSEEGSVSNLDAARAILRDGGWEVNPETQIWEKEIDKTVTPLAFSISTANTPVFEVGAEYIAATWKALGAEVTTKLFEQSDLTQSTIRPREYEALFFGTQLGRPLDYYSFWHSSQRNDPGLNVALYANITTDSILFEVRRTGIPEERKEAIQKFANELSLERPALFLYAPELLYILPKEVHGANFTGLSEPHERFASIRDWYRETESVWPFFTQNNE